MPVFHKLKIAAGVQETDDTVSIAFHVPTNLKDEYKHIQGQYLTLKTILKGEDIRRSYSISSGVHENELRVAVKKIKGGLFSSFANDTVKVGDEMEVMTPMGNFYTHMKEENEKHYLGFAAGSGITPIISMIKTSLALEKKSHFTLIYANRLRSSIIFLEELSYLKNTYMGRFNLLNILEHEAQEIDFLKGRIDAEKTQSILTRVLPQGGADEVYLCGPVQMIETITPVLEAAGMDKKNIHFELFTSANMTTSDSAAKDVKKVRAEGTSVISLLVDGDTTQFELKKDTDSILDMALSQGADLPFACKGGVCCTCRAKLVEGEVDMRVNYSLEKDEVEAGFILTCQSFPLSDKVVVDFDQR
jgi:ring-1,2-phenylacetyl-CoA epoxidase subunit PaaE